MKFLQHITESDLSKLPDELQDIMYISDIDDDNMDLGNDKFKKWWNINKEKFKNGYLLNHETVRGMIDWSDAVKAIKKEFKKSSEFTEGDDEAIAFE